MRIKEKTLEKLTRKTVLIFCSLLLISLIAFAIAGSFNSASRFSAEASITEEEVSSTTLNLRAETLLLSAIVESVAQFLDEGGEIDYEALPSWIIEAGNLASEYEIYKNDSFIAENIFSTYTYLANIAFSSFLQLSPDQEESYGKELLYAGFLAQKRNQTISHSPVVFHSRLNSFLVLVANAVSPASAASKYDPLVQAAVAYIKNPKTPNSALQIRIVDRVNEIFKTDGAGGVQEYLNELKKAVLTLPSSSNKTAALGLIDTQKKHFPTRKADKKPPEGPGKQATQVLNQLRGASTSPSPGLTEPGFKAPLSQPTEPPKSGTLGEEKADTRPVYRYEAGADNISYALLWDNHPATEREFIEGDLNNSFQTGQKKELNLKNGDPLASAAIIPVGWRDKPGEPFAYPTPEEGRKTFPWREKVGERQEKSEKIAVENVNWGNPPAGFYTVMKIIEHESESLFSGIGKRVRKVSESGVGIIVTRIPVIREGVAAVQILDGIMQRLNGLGNTDRRVVEISKGLLNEVRNEVLKADPRFRLLDLRSLTPYSDGDVGVTLGGVVYMEEGQMYLELKIHDLSKIVASLEKQLEEDKSLLEKYQRDSSPDYQMINRQYAKIIYEESILNAYKKPQNNKDGFRIKEDSLILPKERIKLTLVDSPVVILENSPKESSTNDSSLGAILADNNSAETGTSNTNTTNRGGGKEYVWRAEKVPISATVTFSQAKKGCSGGEGKNRGKECRLKGELSIEVRIPLPANGKLQVTPLVVATLVPDLSDSETATIFQGRQTTRSGIIFDLDKNWVHSALKARAISAAKEARK